MTEPDHAPFVRVEEHMSTVVTLSGHDIGDALADEFFDRIRRLEDLLSRFRPRSEASRFERGELDRDSIGPLLREVLERCETLRDLTHGDFEHQPRRRTGNPADPALDVNALAKGWIIEEASIILRLHGARYLVNAGGDVTASTRIDGTPWRIGVQHPEERDALLGVFEVLRGAVATSGSYERGHHIRSGDHACLTSVTVVGSDLAEADGLSTAVYASGQSPPEWWYDVDPSYGLLTLSTDNRLRWLPPTTGGDIKWQFPTRASVRQETGGRDGDQVFP